MQYAANCTGKVAGCGRSFSRRWIVSIGNEPGVAPAPPIAPAGVAPASDVALVLIRHAERQPVERCRAARGKMEDVFVAIVEESRRADRFEMATRNLIPIFVRQGDGLDPVNSILKHEKFSQTQNQFVRQHRI